MFWAWARWEASRPAKTVKGPGKGVEELAAALTALFVAVRDKNLADPYVGPMVNGAIRGWKAPLSNRRISKQALEHLKGGGAIRALKEEHDPPIAFFRDIVRGKVLVNPDAVRDTLTAYLLEMRVTLLTPGEDERLTNNDFKSIRPPGAYEFCLIERVPYPSEDECHPAVRSALYQKRKRKRLATAAAA